jgi:hypothetical protein
MVATAIRTNDMNLLVAALEPILDKRKQNAVLLIRAVEEGTDVT